MVVYLHSPLSPNGQRVAIALIKKKVPFKLIAAQNIRSEEYLASHPVRDSSQCAFGPLMALIVWPNALLNDVDNMTLFETRAIARYNASKYSTSGAPSVGDIEANTPLDQRRYSRTQRSHSSAHGLVNFCM